MKKSFQLMSEARPTVAFEDESATGDTEAGAQGGIFGHTPDRGGEFDGCIGKQDMLVVDEIESLRAKCGGYDGAADGEGFDDF